MSDFEDFESDDSIDDILESPLLTPQLSKEGIFNYEVLSTDKLVHKMEDYIKEINSVIEPPIPKATAIVLLDNFKWDKGRFMECYFTDTKKVYKEAKISEPKTEYEKVRNNRMKRLKSEDEILCEICFTEQPKIHNTGLEECGHVYCNHCWKGYLKNKVYHYNCYIMIDLNLILFQQSYLKFIETLKRRSKMVTAQKHFVQHRLVIHWWMV